MPGVTPQGTFSIRSSSAEGIVAACTDPTGASTRHPSVRFSVLTISMVSAVAHRGHGPPWFWPFGQRKANR
jgi:hypothetical protein